MRKVTKESRKNEASTRSDIMQEFFTKQFLKTELCKNSKHNIIHSSPNLAIFSGQRSFLLRKNEKVKHFLVKSSIVFLTWKLSINSECQSKHFFDIFLYRYGTGLFTNYFYFKGVHELTPAPTVRDRSFGCKKILFIPIGINVLIRFCLANLIRTSIK